MRSRDRAPPQLPTNEALAMAGACIVDGRGVVPISRGPTPAQSAAARSGPWRRRRVGIVPRLSYIGADQRFSRSDRFALTTRGHAGAPFDCVRASFWRFSDARRHVSAQQFIGLGSSDRPLSGVRMGNEF